MPSCVDCGKETSGIRCLNCNGQFIKKTHADALADADLDLLAMRDVEHLSYARIGERLGLSHTRVRQRLQDARRRERVRQGITE